MLKAAKPFNLFPPVAFLKYVSICFEEEKLLSADSTVIGNVAQIL